MAYVLGMKVTDLAAARERFLVHVDHDWVKDDATDRFAFGYGGHVDVDGRTVLQQRFLLQKEGNLRQPATESTALPTFPPTAATTAAPSDPGSYAPTLQDTYEPTYAPTLQDTYEPTYAPTLQDTYEPTSARTAAPSPFTRVPTTCLLYTSPSPRDKRQSRMPSSA